MAWLHATPEKQRLPRGVKLEIDQRGGAEVPELEPPEVEPTLEYLVEYLFKVGPVLGEHELTFAELDAWCRRTGRDLDDFESDALKTMSRAYLGMLHQAQKPDCPFPVLATEGEEDEAAEAARQDKLDAQLRAAFGAMANTPQNKVMTRKGKG